MAERFRVLSQSQTTDIRPGGGFYQVMRVTAETTGSQVVFSVNVPLSQYGDAGYVHDLLDARAREIDKIHVL